MSPNSLVESMCEGFCCGRPIAGVNTDVLQVDGCPGDVIRDYRAAVQVRQCDPLRNTMVTAAVPVPRMLGAPRSGSAHARVGTAS